MDALGSTQRRERATPGPPPRRTRTTMARPPDADSSETIARILEAAQYELREARPRNAVSMRAVADRARVSLGTLQYYFSNKEALLEACLDGYYERLGGLVAEAFAYTAAHASDPIRELVRHAALQHYRFLCRERALVELRLITNCLRGELHPQRQVQYMVQVFGNAAKVLSPRVGLSEIDVRVSIQALAYTAVRMAVLSPSERENLTGATGEVADALIEEYVVEAACRLLCPAVAPPA